MSDILVMSDVNSSIGSRRAWADWAGMIASIGCAIHCAAMPLVLAYLPALGLDWLAGESFHRWMAVICFAIAAFAFVPGLKKHRSVVPAMWGATGLLLLMASAFAIECSSCSDCSTESCLTAASQTSGEMTYLPVQTGDEISAVRSESGGILDFLAPYVTPLGGLLLVVGHVINHRKSCRCQKNKCCLD